MELYNPDMASQHPNSVRLFPNFTTYRTAYKHIDGEPIHAFFIVPNELPPGPRPLFVRYHGGGWVEGEAEASMRPLSDLPSPFPSGIYVRLVNAH